MTDSVKLSANAQKIMDMVGELTIIELADLVSAMEEKFGVSAAAPVAASGAAWAAWADEAEEKTTVNVVLTSAGAAKIAVIKVLRELTGLGLAEAKAIADNGGNVKENVSRADAEGMKKSLEEAGASVELK
ncbi:MAG: 50S ribosomal protein L7/L12 [uncultured bacterium (gcode 4)]|uniref:Large ribosomal subunit protein bL12 n=1 Tax=uncultured bacterium (gcode 4) TaxID=1234023 RepID=K2BDJ4_9BACT|nr:MAG: 50S ribosomal protein L7/L12 [uncultured bacterium (gcode 4)]